MLRLNSNAQPKPSKRFLLLYIVLFCLTTWSIGQTLWESAQVIRLRNLSVILEKQHRQLADEISQLKAEIDQNKSVTRSLASSTSVAYEPMQIYLSLSESDAVANLVTP
ncbi:MAG TPA: hypothetical protein PKX78_00600 [Candidatus Woesebacteria bacterium]|jgi:cell division protein FtsB|nr:hypothetical protein [Candidatus Woesebacteria bacterium]